MGNPQLENGYTKIANEILDALVLFKLPGVELRITLFIIRKTYGYNKKSDWISNSQFVSGTGLEKSNVCRALNKLTDKKIVVKDDNKGMPKYRLNKRYKDWRMLSPTTTKSKSLSPVIIPVVTGDKYSELSPVTNTKETNITKEKTTPPKLLPMEKAKLIFDFQKIVNGNKDHALVMKYVEGNESFEVMQKRLGIKLRKLKMEK